MLDRYQGFSRLLDSFRQLGLLSLRPLSSLPDNWTEFLAGSVTRAMGTSRHLRQADVPSAVSDLVGPEEAEETIQALEW